MSNLAVIQNFTLPGEICRKFAVDWSQDNKISVCTSKAVYIMVRKYYSVCSLFKVLKKKSLNFVINAIYCYM